MAFSEAVKLAFERGTPVSLHLDNYGGFVHVGLNARIADGLSDFVLSWARLSGFGFIGEGSLAFIS